MSDPQRREFLAAAGMASLAALGGAQPAAGGDPSFMNNVPDPTLAGKDLPTFKFALEKSDGKVIGNSYGKEATVTQLPISKGIAGVSMRLEPGAMRELHWHATAAEWAFVIEGRVRTTVIDLTFQGALVRAELVCADGTIVVAHVGPDDDLPKSVRSFVLCRAVGRRDRDLAPGDRAVTREGRLNP